MTRLIFQHLIRFGKPLFTDFETAFFAKLTNLLDTESAEILRTQLGEINLVQRIIDDEEISFYRIEHLRVSARRERMFSGANEFILCNARVGFGDVQPVDVKVWIVSQKFFMLEFNAGVKKYRKSTDFDLELIDVDR